MVSLVAAEVVKYESEVVLLLTSNPVKEAGGGLCATGVSFRSVPFPENGATLPVFVAPKRSSAAIVVSSV